MKESRRTTLVSASIAAGLSVLILVPAKLKASFTILLADRLVPGLGWVQIALLVAYAVFVAVKLNGTQDTRRIRLTIWIAFSVVFFLQFILGVSGLDILLMTGRLHVPVPAVVIGGPIFRGARFFMPILFLSTIVLAGPAWCSYLCYFGAWDGLAASRKRHAGPRRQWWTALRISTLVAVPVAAALFRATGVPGVAAAWVAVGFGVVGLGITGLLSIRAGSMAHCTGYCPLGLAANLLGKVSPFRVRIADSCTACGACIRSCRYGALDTKRIEARKPGLTCTLCGDCLSACVRGDIRYTLGRLGSPYARTIFMSVVAALHACFLGIARI